MYCSRSTSLFDHLVGAGEQHRWHFEAERFRSLEIDTQLVFGRLVSRRSGSASCRHASRSASIASSIEQLLAAAPDVVDLAGRVRGESENIRTRSERVQVVAHLLPPWPKIVYGEPVNALE